MVTTTFLGLNKPDKGTLDWDVPLNQNFDIIDSWAQNLGIDNGSLTKDIAGANKNITGLYSVQANRLYGQYIANSSDLDVWILLYKVGEDISQWFMQFAIQSYAPMTLYYDRIEIGDLLPVSDNSTNIGSATKRFANIYAVTVNQGDAVFKNGWRITEGEDYGYEGLLLIAPDGRKFKFVLEEVE